MTQSPEERSRRNLEAVKRFNERKLLGIAWESPDGPARIGNVPRLAPDEVNPLWNIEKHLPKFAKRIAPLLEATEIKRGKKLVSVEGKGLFLTKTVDIDNEDTVIE